MAVLLVRWQCRGTSADSPVEYSLRHYVAASGKRPFAEWLYSLSDGNAAARVQIRQSSARYGTTSRLVESVHLRNGCTPCQMAMPRHECRFAWRGSAWVISEMPDPWVRGYLNCASILVRDTGFTSWSKADRS